MKNQRVRSEGDCFLLERGRHKESDVFLTWVPCWSWSAWPCGTRTRSWRGWTPGETRPPPRSSTWGARCSTRTRGHPLWDRSVGHEGKTCITQTLKSAELWGSRLRAKLLTATWCLFVEEMSDCLEFRWLESRSTQRSSSRGLPFTIFENWLVVPLHVHTLSHYIYHYADMFDSSELFKPSNMMSRLRDCFFWQKSAEDWEAARCKDDHLKLNISKHQSCCVGLALHVYWVPADSLGEARHIKSPHMCSNFWPIKPTLIGEFENVNAWHMSLAWQRRFNQSAQFQGEDMRTNTKHGHDPPP